MKILELFESDKFLKVPEDYEPVLSDADDIVAYMNAFSTEDLDEELMLDYFRGCKAVLKLLPVSSIHQGDPNHNIINPKKQKQYLKLNTKTIPPIIVDNGTVIDGNHRFRVAKALGLTQIWAYVIINGVNEAMCDADKEMLAAMDHTVVAEHEKAGYNLFLIQQPDFIARMMDGCKYQLGLSKAGTECTNHEQHSMKFMKQGERVPLSQLGPFLSVINSWVKKYGRIIVASAEPSKTVAYGRIIAKRLPDLDIKDKSVMGKEYLVLSAKINEMAIPSAKISNTTYYHGTTSPDAANNIIKNGIQPPDLSLRKGLLRPVLITSRLLLVMYA